MTADEVAAMDVGLVRVGRTVTLRARRVKPGRSGGPQVHNGHMGSFRFFPALAAAGMSYALILSPVTGAYADIQQDISRVQSRVVPLQRQLLLPPSRRTRRPLIGNRRSEALIDKQAN